MRIAQSMGELESLKINGSGDILVDYSIAIGHITFHYISYNFFGTDVFLSGRYCERIVIVTAMCM